MIQNVGKKAWKVLIVDDEEMIRNLLVTALEDLDFEIKAAGSGTEGFLMAAEFFPDLIISDIVMAGGTGAAMTKRLREELPDYSPRIIMISGYSQFTDSEIRGLGVDRVIAKPFHIRSIISSIREVLDIGV